MKKEVACAVFFLSVAAATPFANGGQIPGVETDPLLAGSMLYVVASEPYRVLIDGTLAGTAPRLVSDLSEGTHRLSVESEHLVYRRILIVDPSITVVTRLNPVMQPYTGTLVVESHGVPADVTLDGARIGSTPLRIERIAAGTHTLAIGGGSHARVDRVVVVPRDESARVDVELEPGYRLNLDPLPAAEATIDVVDATTGESRSFRFAELPLLPAGTQEFKVTLDGFEPFEFSADPAQSADTPIRFSPKQIQGTVRLVGLPEGGTVTINGTRVDMASGAGAIPVSVGLLAINVEAERFFPYKELVFVEAGQTVELNLDLKKNVGNAYKAAGWASLASGAALSVGGLVLNLDSIAISATGSYSGYTTWKYSSLAAAGIGVAALVSSILLFLKN